MSEHKVKVCGQCFSPIDDSIKHTTCPNCNASIFNQKTMYLEEAMRLAEQYKKSTLFEATIESDYGEKSITLLRIMAWLNLVFGVIAAIYFWSVTGNIQDSYGRYVQVDRVGNLLVFVCVFEAFGGYALLTVIASIAGNLIAIRKGMEKKHP